MDTSRFYNQLESSDSIRILELTRSTSEDRPFNGRLVYERLSDFPPYSALSYAWGTLSPSDATLYVGDDPFKVTQSLYDVLQILVARHDVIRLWVDQISINQEDKTEKQEQVLLMSQTFSQA
jgi:Heterokaryon incompatibility protein (HET)